MTLLSSKPEVEANITNIAKLGLRIKHDQKNISLMKRRIAKLERRVGFVEDLKKEYTDKLTAYCDGLYAKSLRGDKKADKKIKIIKGLVDHGCDAFKKVKAQIDRMPNYDSDNEIKETAVPKILLVVDVVEEGDGGKKMEEEGEKMEEEGKKMEEEGKKMEEEGEKMDGGEEDGEIGEENGEVSGDDSPPPMATEKKKKARATSSKKKEAVGEEDASSSSAEDKDST